MSNLAVKIAVIESESGWGRKIDDWMVCLSTEDAKAYQKEFNSKNTSDTVPDWYMQVEGEPTTIELTDNQFSKLNEDKRVWLSVLNNIKDDDNLKKEFVYEDESIYSILLDLVEGNGINEVFITLHNVASELGQRKELEGKFDDAKKWVWSGEKK